MKKTIPPISRLLFLLLVGFMVAIRLPAQANAFQTTFPVTASEPVAPYLSQPVSNLLLTDSALPENFETPLLDWQGKVPSADLPTHPDPLAPSSLNGGTAPEPLLTFEGLAADGWTPPDPVGDVGPNHFVQMVNVSFQIWDKGDPDQSLPPTVIQPATPFKALFSGTGGQCEGFTNGAPMVLYDDPADRWLMSQIVLGNPYVLCVAVSTTPDPTGTYYLYEFPMPANPDLPKLAAWPDAYYLGTHSGTPHEFYAHALDRNRMLAGLIATRQSVGNLDNFVMPADLDGPTPPPPNAPGMFYTLYAEGYPDHPTGPDRLAVYEFHPAWETPAQSTFALAQELPTADFNYTVCGYLVLDCIPQPGTPQTLDSASSWPMFRFQYRNFGSYASLVGNFTVDGDGEDPAAIRWFEIRKTGSTYTLFQEGTYAPDGNHRWMGSIAMDKVGNIALGYNVSGYYDNGDALKPSLWYTARLLTDPLGTMGAEAELWEGHGVQTSGNRWGDYSSLVVDPVNGCHFWFTGEYHDADGSGFEWNTRVGVFKLPGCEGDPGTVTGHVTDGSGSLPGAQIHARGFITQTGSTTTDEEGNFALVLPTGTYVVTATAYGFLPSVVSGVEVISDTVTVQNLTLAPAPMYTLSGVVTDAQAGWPMYAKINIPGLPPRWTDPATGAYELVLPDGQWTLEISAWQAGYLTQVHEILVQEDLARDFALAVDEAACLAPGYLYEGTLETFDEAALPPGWQNVDNVIRLEPQQIWRFDNPSGRTNLTGGTGAFAIMDSEYWSQEWPGANQDSSLITSLLDFSGMATVRLAFDTDFKVWEENETNESARVEVSSDGGTTWHTVWQRDAAGGDFNGHVELDISSFAAQEAEVLIQFRYADAQDDYWWQVDNVAYGALACDPLPGGWVVGTVVDDNFQVGLTGVPLTIISPMTNTTLTTLATPDDPALADGFYTFFTPPGAITLTTNAPYYGVISQTLPVTNGTTTRQDFLLPAGWLVLEPEELALSLGFGYSATLPLQISNLGGLSAAFARADAPVPWLSLAPATGTLPTYSALDFQFMLTTASLTQTGVYTTHLLFTNDTPYGNLSLPVTLTAGPPTPAISGGPDQTQIGEPGTTVAFTLVLTNTGNVPDWFEATVNEQKWESTITLTSFFLNPGDHVVLEITTAIPLAVFHREKNVTTLTITGVNSGASVSMQLMTIAQYPYVLFLPATFR